MKPGATFKHVVALVILVGLVAILLDQVILPIYVRQGQVSYLPNVVGLSYGAALKSLRKAGFRASRSHVARTHEYPPNQVFEMYPKAYSRVKKGRIIQLTVTEEEKMVEIPALVNKTLRAAEIEIARAGLLIDTVMTTYSDNFAAGVVTWQSPKGGNLLRRGSGMSLMVSKGEPPVSYYVPSVLGKSYQNARREILDAGLDIGSIRYIYAPNLLPNTIVDQSIAGGTVLKLKRAMNLTISTYDRSKEH
ncbi:MAG: PASTA domain-containing protein [Candidatus Marinimicrobia bacterium]|nr:PASTA domain-containing protein [Candidatus Neomarinimicrobiota bacterium]